MKYKNKIKKEYPTIEAPSRYGSHASMVVDTIDSFGWVRLRDEKGEYETTRDRLDTGFADPRRYCSSRVNQTPDVRLKVVKKDEETK